MTTLQAALQTAMNAEETVTENGMPTYSSSLNSSVDLFFKIGGSRGKDITGLFSKAFNTDPEIAGRIALWTRDIRGGAGERQLFKSILTYAVSTDVEYAKRLMVKIPEVGRWDDLFVFFGTKLERDALRMIAEGLKNGDGLCAKWMPRKGPHASKIRAYLQVTPKQYRKTLVKRTDVVEQKMCAKEWNSIEFDKLPSLASARYQAAFGRNAPELYEAYKRSLEAGSTKINASAVYPYDIVKSLQRGDERVANQQWLALPDYLEGSKENLLPVVDVSGSMSSGVGGSTTISCMDVALSLGLYISERSKGIFKDSFITFSERPQLQHVRGSLKDRMNQMKKSNWDMTTDLERVFETVLNAAVKHKVPIQNMPTQLIILSDMQFNQAIRNSGDKVFEMIERRYKESGYEMPKIVFWNLRSSNGVPVEFDKKGTALVSGFSPAIMKSVLNTSDFNPTAIMMSTVGNERYNF